MQRFLYPLLGLALLCSCEKKDNNGDLFGKPLDESTYSGLYLLSEGSWGGNNARLDYLDFASGTMLADIYTVQNPGVVLSLGSTANDLQQHDDRLYAVLNGSDKVEVMDLDGHTLGHVDVPQPRTIAFAGQYGYVTSYAGGGTLVRFDLNTLTADASITVGPEPEGICESNGKLYIAMAGWSQAPDYADDVAVVSIADFKVIDRIHSRINLKYIAADTDGYIWVTSVGNYGDIPSALCRIDPVGGRCQETGIAATRFAIAGDKVYYYNAAWDNASSSYIVDYGTIDRRTLAPGKPFINDSTETTVSNAYGLCVNAETGHVFLSDSKGYDVEGELRVYDSDGVLQSKVSTGICPAHMVIVKKNK